VVKSAGPFEISGGWWVREVRRSYQFLETKRGDVAWVFYDRQRRRWYLQGQVE
jgi:protein ImuB